MDKIISHLQQKYNPKAILLHGSRLREECPENSDYDLVLVGSEVSPVLPHIFAGRALDVCGVDVNTEIIETGGKVPIWPLRVLFDDTDALGAALCTRTHAAYMKGPTPMSAQEWENRKNYTARLLGKIEARGANAALRRQYLSDLYPRLCRYWFEKRQLWTMPTHLAWALLEREDPEFYFLMDELWTERYLSAGRELEKILFSSAS